MPNIQLAIGAGTGIMLAVMLFFGAHLDLLLYHGGLGSAWPGLKNRISF
jgi:hypothetical protein